jgi:type II secretory pathway component PulF
LILPVKDRAPGYVLWENMEPTNPPPPDLPLPPVAPATPVIAPANFSYQAQTNDGQRFSGTMEAANAEEATRRLEAMRLRVLEIARAQPMPRARPLRGDDFAAFNQQLAQLTAAGMPVEQGLRLIATDLRKGRMARTIEQVAAEMERGTPLDQAFEKHAKQFPPLYGRLIRAGIKSNNLSGVLLNLGRHLEAIGRLRQTLWATIAYPLFVLITFGLLISFLALSVLPQFEHIYADFHIRLPVITRILIAFGHIAPVLLGILLVVAIGGPLMWGVLQAMGHGPAVVERLLVPLPLVGRVLRDNLLARWCDAARIAVDAGMDLPAAFSMAGEATRSGRLTRDGQALSAALAAGQPLTNAKTSLLPPSVPATLQFASGTNDLGTTLGSLAELYQRQADLRLAALPGILTPVLVIVLALLIGFVILGLLAPLIALIEGISGGSGGGGLKL